MKKKFVLTSALVLIVVASLAAATALEVSGTFKTGYKFEFANPATTTFSDSTFATVNSAFTGDFWKVTLTAPYKAGKDTGATAKADIYLSDALAAEGVDMGDLAVTLHAGTGVGTG
ncbi:MAG TPA: hypothetical protein VFC80_00500, partial [Sphaerochaeta sp.]|nr:hypothetical protein [Sphaerochaeta sp.]